MSLQICSEAVSVTTCTKSYDCGQGMCCRAADGTVLSDQQQNGGFGPIFMHPDGGHQNGTCSTRLAQKGEVCDSNCDCDTGKSFFGAGGGGGGGIVKFSL